jgi:hypothetical protein
MNRVPRFAAEDVKMLDLYPSRSLSLGIPHLDPGGAGLHWLARECRDMHCWHFGMPLAEIRDLSSERVAASGANCSIEGRLHLTLRRRSNVYR